MKKLLTILLTLFLFSSVYADEQKTTYYPTGEVKEVQKYVDGKLLKATAYYKTGEVEKVLEYIDSKVSKTTLYHKNGKVKGSNKWVDKLLNFSF
jgi:antitoxin component YwqK of YwqJK toxin-antitoxin module